MKIVSLHNLEESTQQEVFDFVVTHLLTQNERATEGNGCGYRVKKEDRVLMCAAGCLIPDDVYTPKMEGLTWSGLYEHKLINIKAHKDFISVLQNVHDLNSVEKWKEKLVSFAEIRNLNYDILNNFKNETKS